MRLLTVISKYIGRRLYSNKKSNKKSEIVSFVEEINKCKHLENKINLNKSPDLRVIKTMIKALGLPYLLTSETDKKAGEHLNETYWFIDRK